MDERLETLGEQSGAGGMEEDKEVKKRRSVFGKRPRVEGQKIENIDDKLPKDETILSARVHLGEEESRFEKQQPTPTTVEAVTESNQEDRTERLIIPTRQLIVDWSSFPLFPLNQIPLLGLKDLHRTAEELKVLYGKLQGSQDPGDAALQGYIRKEMTSINERAHNLRAAERVQQMLEGKSVPQLSELRFDENPEFELRETPETFSIPQPTSKLPLLKQRTPNGMDVKKDVGSSALDFNETTPQTSLVPNTKPPLVPFISDEEHVEESKQNEKTKKINEQLSPVGKERDSALVASQKETEKERSFMERRKNISFRKEIGKDIASTTWGKTFVVYADTPKKKRRQQQEEERTRMLENAKRRAKKKKDAEKKKKIEQRKIAMEKLREREAAREKWEQERKERIERAKLLAKRLAEEKEAQVGGEELQNDRTPNNFNGKKGKKESAPIPMQVDEEEDEEQVRLQEALEEEEAANEDDNDKSQSKNIVNSSAIHEELEESDEETDEDLNKEDEDLASSTSPRPESSMSTKSFNSPSLSTAASSDEHDDSDSDTYPSIRIGIPDLVEVAPLSIVSEGQSSEESENGSTYQQYDTVEAKCDLISSQSFPEENCVEQPQPQDEEKQCETVELENTNSIQLDDSQDEESHVDRAMTEQTEGNQDFREKRVPILDQLKSDMEGIRADLKIDLSIFKEDLESTETAREGSNVQSCSGSFVEVEIGETHTSPLKGDDEKRGIEETLNQVDESDSSSVSSSEETLEDTTANLNASGALEYTLKQLGNNVVDYSDCFQHFGDLFTVWQISDGRKANRVKILEETIQYAIHMLMTSNPILGHHIFESAANEEKQEEKVLDQLTCWRAGAYERFFRVLSRSRTEVYNIVSEACSKLDALGMENDFLVERLKEKDNPNILNDARRPMRQLPAEVGSLWNLLWTWSKPNVNRELLFSWQRVNHFLNARALTRKDLLKQELQRVRSMSQFLANEFELLPETFILPKEYIQFVDSFSKYGEMYPDSNYWIMKPVGLSRGRGISLVSDIGDVCYGQSVVIQRYLSNPLLLDGYKFDLRIYVLVTSFSPLEAWIYDEGFVRVCTHKYSAEAIDLKNLFIHLTNSSIQKLGPNGSGTKATAESISRHKAEIDEAGGTKLTLTYLWRRLKAQGIDVDAIQSAIKVLILKSLICCDESVSFQPNCFELFGYDVLIDENLRPWLIEINSSPSMAQENLLDTKVKRRLIADTIRLVDPLPFNRAALLDILQRRSAQMEQARLRPFQQQEEKESEKQRLNRELTAIFHGRKPRKFGEEPKFKGLYKRLCPSEKEYEFVKKIIRQDRTKQKSSGSSTSSALSKRSQSKKSKRTSSSLSNVVGKGSLQYLAEGCNIAL